MRSKTTHPVVMIVAAMSLTACATAAPGASMDGASPTSRGDPLPTASAVARVPKSNTRSEVGLQLDAIAPGLSRADAKDADDVCDMLAVEPDRAMVEMTAMNMFDHYVFGGIDLDEAAEIVTMLDTAYCQ